MPHYTKPRRTWHYLNEFKVKAVLLSLLDGVQVPEKKSDIKRTRGHTKK